MNIEKYKYIGNSKYKVKIEDNIYILYEDVILKNELLLKQKITKNELQNILIENRHFEGYYSAIKYIEKKLRTEKEIEHYLVKNDYNSKDIEKIINKLRKDNILNENNYAESYINDQINLKLVGPLKIKNDLIKLGISEDIIDEKLNCYTKELQEEKIKKYIEKKKKNNKNKSMYYLKNKIVLNLINRGFFKDDILSILNNYSFNDDSAYDKEYKKLHDKYSKKYSGRELDYIITQKLYQKGFKYRKIDY